MDAEEVALAFDKALDLGRTAWDLPSELVLELDFNVKEELRDDFVVSGDLTSASRLSVRKRVMPKGGLAIDDVCIVDVVLIGMAADDARPRGIRSPVPGPLALEGNDTDAERIFVYDSGLWDNREGVGEVNRLSLNIELGRDGDVTDPERCRSTVVAIKRRVKGDGASSSSLQRPMQSVLRTDRRNYVSC